MTSVPDGSAVDTDAPSPSLRLVTIAVVYGALAGMVAGLTYLLTGLLSDLVWSVSDARWYVFVAILVGGILLAVLRPSLDASTIDLQIAESADPRAVRWRRTAVLAAAAIVAVGFGGAIGPEAGLLAVVAELSALVSHAIARNHAEEQLIGRSGSAAALAGLYGSPPGAAAYDDDALSPPKALPFLAAIAGFATFLATVRALGHGGVDLGLPAYDLDTALDLLRAVLPAALAAVVAYAYLHARPQVAAALGRVGTPRAQTLVGTLVFAALATAWPLLRFSGHEEFVDVVELADESAWFALAALALAKLLATAICVSSGWLGGEFFPLMFAGAAAGAATLALVPGLEVTAAMASGVGAATAIGLRKPLAALLISALLLGGLGLAPLMIGVAVAVAALRAFPLPEGMRAGAH